MTTQIEMHLTSAPVSVVNPRLDQLISIVIKHPEGITARQLIAHGFTDRELRELVAQDNGRQLISGPGSPGYRHTSAVTIDEIRHTAQSMISQGKKMAHRGIAMLRNAHQRLNRADQ